MSRRSRLALLGSLLLVALATVPAAGAANRRVSISDYRWSTPDVQVDLGEHVTWYWVGPDTMHSITGTSPNSLGVDSDPGVSQPDHRIGDTFQTSFDQPGVYSFHCKLHTTVKGTVTVTADPGDPASEPDPVPQSKVDRSAPKLRDVRLGSPKFGRRGTSLRFSIGETSKVSADYYRYDADGKRRFTGYATWPAHIGFNGVRIANKRKHFNPRPGSYLAVLRATDEANNVSATKRVRFLIRKR